MKALNRYTPAISAAVLVLGASVALFAFAAMLARADTLPVVTTTILNASNASTTTAAIGALVHDSVSVATSTASTTPTGTVNFNLYNNMSCIGTPTTQSGVALVNGSATSSPTAVPAGGLSYQVMYNGDASNSATLATCQPLTATAPSPVLTTNLSTSSVLAGSSVNDTATLASSTNNAGGTVAYVVYTNNTCSVAMQGAGVVTVTNSLVPNSNSVQFNTPGTFYWQAAYSGDANNAAATSTCGSEVLTVGATSTPVTATTPTLTTTIMNASNATTTTAAIGSAVSDKVVVTPTGSSSTPTGTVNFNRYGNMSCSGTATTQSGVSLVNGVANSAVTTVPAGGLSYQVTYNGDAQNLATTSACEPLTATAASIGITTTLSTSSVLAGSSVNDTATLGSTTANAGGTVGYVVYTNNTCSLALQGAGVRTVTNGIVPNSDSVVFNTPGTFYWQAAYSGDANNAAATSTCGSEVLTVNATTSPVTTTPGSISGTVYNDLNNNQVKDGSDVGLPNFRVWLHLGNSYSGSIIFSVITDANGTYTFPNLAAGTYFVEQQLQNGWNQTTADMKVKLSTASSSAVVNFADISTNRGNNGNGNGHHRCDGDGDSDDIGCTATSTATSTNHGNGNNNGGGFHFPQFNFPFFGNHNNDNQGSDNRNQNNGNQGGYSQGGNSGNDNGYGGGNNDKSKGNSKGKDR